MTRTPSEVAHDERVIETALHYLKGLTPSQLLTTWTRAQSLVTAAEYPRLFVSTEPQDDDTEAPSLVCPHCENVITHGEDGWVNLDVVDVAWRTTNAEGVDFGEHEVAVYYDGSGDYEGLNYACGHCAEPVRLPEGWREV